jgi:hypothetical protein
VDLGVDVGHGAGALLGHVVSPTVYVDPGRPVRTRGCYGRLAAPASASGRCDPSFRDPADTVVLMPPKLAARPAADDAVAADDIALGATPDGQPTPPEPEPAVPGAAAPDATAPDETSPDGAGFLGLGLDERLVAALSGLGYEEPTDIQRAAIPSLLAGRDVLAEAPTGTGKTAAFALPMVQSLGAIHPRDRDGRPRAFVLTPTRELAIQVAEAIHRYGQPFAIRVLPVYGGQAIGQQLRGLARGVDVLVATPGRAVDHLTRASIALDRIEMVVLDEADEMLDMGFAEDLEAILSATPKTRQTALFSATISPPIA